MGLGWGAWRVVLERHTPACQIFFVEVDLDLLSQQLQVGSVIELTILDGDLAPGQTVEMTIVSQRMTRYHLFLYFQYQIHSFNLAEVETEASSEKIDLTVDHMDIISSEQAYISTYDSKMCWSNQRVAWKKIGSHSNSS